MIESDGFEGPLFKVLPKNDTADGAGHVGGFVVPKDFVDFFPDLPPATTVDPVPDRPIQVEMLVGPVALGTTTGRFQRQTWGGTRSGELRVTDINELRSRTNTADILLIQRSLEDIDTFRFTLIKTSDPIHASILRTIGSKRWGSLPGGIPMAKRQDLEQAASEIEAQTAKPFQLFDDNPTLQTHKRLARDRAFRTKVLSAYSQQCSFCLGGLENNAGLVELEGAHIVPRRLRGVDDIRNGLALCRSHHWAFDKGMVGVTSKYVVEVAAWASAKSRNATLSVLHGKTIALPSSNPLHPNAEALEWHRRHVFAP